LGYPNRFWWAVLTRTSELLGAPIAADVPVGICGEIEDCMFVFKVGLERLGLICFEWGDHDQCWVERAMRLSAKVRTLYSTKTVIILVHHFEREVPSQMPEGIFLLVENDSQEAANKIAALAGLEG
jgi:hypothetical protein